LNIPDAATLSDLALISLRVFFRSFVKYGTRPHFSYESTKPDGRMIEVRRNPVPDGGFVLIFSDITERKHSEEEIRSARDAAEAAYRDPKAAQASLIQAEKMASLGQLTAGIAHEIKNPLNFVNNFAELSIDLLGELNEAVANNRQAEVEELTGTLKGNLGKIAEHGRRTDGIRAGNAGAFARKLRRTKVG
jgi:C4-dicarboxylate-specific signal transduction histidine kinase